VAVVVYSRIRKTNVMKNQDGDQCTIMCNFQGVEPFYLDAKVFMNLEHDEMIVDFSKNLYEEDDEICSHNVLKLAGLMSKIVSIVFVGISSIREQVGSFNSLFPSVILKIGQMEMNYTMDVSLIGLGNTIILDGKIKKLVF
jgi:hypothetical protein